MYWINHSGGTGYNPVVMNLPRGNLNLREGGVGGGGGVDIKIILGVNKGKDVFYWTSGSAFFKPRNGDIENIGSVPGGLYCEED